MRNTLRKTIENAFGELWTQAFEHIMINIKKAKFIHRLLCSVFLLLALPHVMTIYFINRLKDGNIVATTSGGSSSSYVLTSLTMDDAGYYKCRANNDYGAIVSSEAQINVKGTLEGGTIGKIKTIYVFYF